MIFRRKIPPKDKPDFDALSACADRYDVSLVAAVLRWLRYTDRRALIVVSTDGFVKWAWSSAPALKTGRFTRTSNGPVALPRGSAVGQNQLTPESKTGIDHPTGVWFDEPVREHSIRIDKYDLNYTLLHLDGYEHAPFLAEPHIEDTYDRFNNGGL